jgi:hypothetical protein
MCGIKLERQVYKMEVKQIFKQRDYYPNLNNGWRSSEPEGVNSTYFKKIEPYMEENFPKLSELYDDKKWILNI